ncbi:MAG TPA: hypothetical protein V6D23_10190 [Candidatus Obscuribacterales bacterium]
MNPSQEQNRQEALLALEQLSEQVGLKGFNHHLQRVQELLKSMKLVEPELGEIQAKLDEMQTRHRSWQSGQSQALRNTVEEKIAAAKALYAGEAGGTEQQTGFQQAYDALEEVHHLLEFERQNLTREDRDDCWNLLKTTRKELRDARNQVADQIEAQAETWYLEAKEAVENRRFREAKDIFQALQRDVNQLPLRRDQRSQYREKFNGLWELLQVAGKAQREASQQRQVEGRRKLEEALSKVESFIARKEQDLKAAEARMGDAHWHEVDPIEKQVQRDKDALEDARRRQTELKAKLEDAGRRKEGREPRAAGYEPRAKSQEPKAEAQRADREASQELKAES